VSPPLFATVNEESKDTHPKVTLIRVHCKTHLGTKSFSATEPFRFGTPQ
jgi:hypothetical protein